LAPEIYDQDGVGRFAMSFGFWHGPPIEILACAVHTVLFFASVEGSRCIAKGHDQPALLWS
jgi:hypothetical protein